MNQIDPYLQAARLRTLPLSLSSTIVGNAMAYYFGVFHLSIFLMTLGVVILLQILSNYANDLGDSEKGTDNVDRIGPKRTIQAGLFSHDEMKRNINIIIGLTLASGIGLIIMSNLLWWERILLFILGLSSIFAAVAYTRGHFSYGYKGLGDLSVFIFFGLLGVLGSMYLNLHFVNNAAILPAIGVGLLSVAVLHLNNMRDRIEDQKSKKMTLAVKIGRENGRIYFLLLILFAIIFWASYVFTQNSINWFSYLYWIGFLPLLLILKRFFSIREDSGFDALLKPTALTTFLLSVLFFISQIL